MPSSTASIIQAYVLNDDGPCPTLAFLQMLVSHNCNFVDNSAMFGGAIAVDTNANLTLSNISLLNNSANSLGGALFVIDTSVALVTAGSIISGNIAPSQGGDGGGVFASGKGLVTINGDTKVQGNAAGIGGGVCAGGSAQVGITGVIEFA